MKTLTMILILGLFCFVEVIAQHIPPCQGNAHSSPICWGYATGRAFNKSWNDSQCPLSTLNLSNISEIYFYISTWGNPANIQYGDIIKFGTSHAAYVTQPGSTIADIRVAQYSTIRVQEETNVPLQNVINEFEDPTEYCRKKPLWSVLVQNSFTGGKVGVEGSEHDSPYTLSNLYWNATVSIDAVMDGRTLDNYVRRFRKWTKSGSDLNTSKSTTTKTDNYNYGTAIDHKAFLDKEFNVTFQNSLPGASGGTIKVSGTNRSAPYVAQAIENNPAPTITAEAINQDINRVSYTFSSWSPGGSTSASTPFSITDHITYTANFTAKPLQAENCYAGGVIGNPVQITWSQHPNANVTYKIYRKVKPLGGSTGSETLIASLGNSTTSYADYDYLVTSTYSDDLLSYDVRSYLNGVYSDPNFVQVFGEMNPRQVQDGHLASTAGELPTSYAVSNYPNPFNPSTTISYQLIEEASVTLEIYDVMGRKIRMLVQEQKQAGYYTAKWEGKDNSGRQVASGAYLYRFSAIPTSGKQSFTKSGKLLLTK